jgi:tetratricopeptide (TPR) repeat protein
MQGAIKIFLFTFSLLSLSAKAQTISEIRVQYGVALEDSRKAEALLESLGNINNPDPLLLAYRGAAEALIAKHALNPYKKLDYLDRAMKTLKEAIVSAPNDPEIRFLRFTIQYYVPAFLGYSKNLDEDKSVIVKNFSSMKSSYTAELFQGVGEFMIKSGRCTPSEEAYIRALLA